jgi:hypothetical protein
LRTLGLAVGLGMLGCLAFSGVSYADAPSGGVNCQAGTSVTTSGGIEGFGSTLQRLMQNNVFSAGFTSDVCGAVTPVAAVSGTTGTNMVAYDWKSGTDGETVTLGTNDEGSGAGLAGADCRAGDFWGTDSPYTQDELTSELNAAPGSAGDDGIISCTGGSTNFSALSLPFEPTGPWPGVSDGTDPVMTVPVGGSAVTLMVNLQKRDCQETGTQTAQAGTPEFTGEQISEIMGGDIANWNDARLRLAGQTANTFLANCNVAITRVVRLDDSGSTNAFKQYMVIADNSRSEATSCDTTGGSVAWNSSAILPINGAPNTQWPGQTTAGVSQPIENGCSAIEVPASSGGGALVAVVDGATAGSEGTGNAAGVDGEVGYADLADAKGAAAPVTLAQEQNGAGTGYVTPVKNGLASNCDFSGVTLPGSTAAGNVGLDTTDDWAFNNSVNGEPNHSLPELTPGSAWPDCSLTYDLVYVGTNGSGTVAGSSAPNPIVAMDANQRQTLYAYMTYILSTTGQRNLANNYYAPLPFGLLSSLQTGFQQNY